MVRRKDNFKLLFLNYSLKNCNCCFVKIIRDIMPSSSRNDIYENMR